MSRFECPGIRRIKTHERHIRLRLSPIREANGVLATNSRPGSDSLVEKLRNPIDVEGVAGANRRHLDYDPFNELDVLVRFEDAGLSHLVVLVDREQPALGTGLRRSISTSRVG
jgi:hypothetical protein